MTTRLLQIRLSDATAGTVIADTSVAGTSEVTLSIPDSHKLAKNTVIYLKSYSVLFNTSAQSNTYVTLNIPWLFPGLTSVNLISGLGSHTLILPMTPATRSEHQMNVNWPLYIHEVPSKTTVKITRSDTSANGALLSINLVLETREIEN